MRMTPQRVKLESQNPATATARSVLECGGWRGTVLTPLLTHAPPTDAKAACALTPRPPQSKTCRLRLALCFILLQSALCLPALGQYSIDWYKVSGGGGTSTGGVYSVSGTTGQPDAGAAMSGGNYSVTGGFWSLIAAVPTPDAPALTVPTPVTASLSLGPIRPVASPCSRTAA